MSILLNTLLLYPDHPYGFEDIWRGPLTTDKRVRAVPSDDAQNLKEDGLYAKERALIADIREELRQAGVARCMRLTRVIRMSRCGSTLSCGSRVRVEVLRSSVATDKREEWYSGN